jgi:OmpA-OmpF porin, OOP family
VGIGTPSPRWAEAAVLAIGAVQELGGGSVTFSDADVTLSAPVGTRKADFDRIAGRLGVALPAVFSLKAVLPEPKDESTDAEGKEEAPEFVATRSADGEVQIRGRLPDERTRSAVQSFAHARFGVENTELAAHASPTTCPTGGLCAFSSRSRRCRFSTADR